MADLALITTCGVLELLLLARLRSRVQETTLTAPWWWAVAATLGVAAAEAVIAAGEDARGTGPSQSLRWIAAPLSFCPAMAVLGAKRPQHRAWQFIVLSLWGVLALPGLEHIALRRGSALEMHGVRTAFILALIALGLLNWLPTRRWLAAISIAMGQTMLYSEHLPGTRGLHGAAPWAAAFFVAGTAVLVLQDFTVRREPPSGWDRVWRDFRDDFGALWAVRVAERVNAAAAMNRWPVRLRWDGLHHAGNAPAEESSPSSDSQEALDTALENLLRRFVSQQWIANRRGEGVH
jgi:hypothetical protein